MERLAPEDLVEEWSDLSASSLGPGARLGRYELLIPIAYGGMARVWAARQHGQRGFQKTVAIKTILPHLAHNPEFERMFLDEARIAAGVHHPNVTEIYELGEEGHVLYLAMEWVNGDSLVHVLKGIVGRQVVALEPRIAARIVADACAGLHAAHELCDEDGRLLNVVHRDISPHNILVAQEGTVKVTDFGVAKAYGQMHQATMAGQVKGKIAYMAPEQIGGTTFDRRADVFAMGCVLYEATTGVLPFRGGNDPQVMQAVLKGEYEAPSKLVKNFPPELASIIDRALASEPRMRFATAERMRVALEEWLAKTGSLVTATQVGSLVRQRLGPELDKRRDHVKAAIAMLQGGESGPKQVRPAAGAPAGAGHTPSRSGQSHSGQSHSGQSHSGQSHSGQSHSGVMNMGVPPPAPWLPQPGQPGAGAVPPMRDRVISVPQVPSPAYAPAMAAPQQANVTGSLPVLPATAAAPTGTKYAIAAIAGVGFALLVGGIGLVVWLLATRPHGTEPGAAATTATSAAPATPPTEPVDTSTATATASASAPAPTASAPPAPPAAPPPAVDINSLPTVKPDKPAWVPPPQPRGGGGAPPAKPGALPANPY